MNRSLEYAQLLLKKACEDQWVLDRLIGEPKSPPWTLGFHAQQAVEKAIKAVLAACEIEYPRTHNLGILIDLLLANGVALPTDANRLPMLTPFGVLMRYDDVLDSADEGLPDRPWLQNAVRRTVDWARAKTNPA